MKAWVGDSSRMAVHDTTPMTYRCMQTVRYNRYITVYKLGFSSWHYGVTRWPISNGRKASNSAIACAHLTVGC